MNKKNLKPLLISALLAVGFGASSVGTSFALFTDRADTVISVTSGKVDVEMTADATSLKLFSVAANAQGTILDENNEKYELVEQANNKFANGGSATLENNTLTISKMTPGDKVTFNVGLKNESNVNTKYRLLYSSAEGSEDLLMGVTGSIKANNAEIINLDSTISYVSAWKTLDADVDIDDLSVELYLPLTDGNRYQDLGATITLSIEAVQGNANVTGEETYVKRELVDGEAVSILTEGVYKYNVTEANTKILTGAVNNVDLLDEDLVVAPGVTAIGDGAFANSGIRSLKTSSTVKKIGANAFYSGTSSTATGNIFSVTLNEGLEEIGDKAFKGQPMTSLVIPSSVTTLGVGAFQQCSELEVVEVPASITVLNGTFHACAGLEAVTLHDGLTTIGQDALRETKISQVTIPSTVKSIGAYAFRDCYDLLTVNVDCTTVPEIASNAFLMATPKNVQTITFNVKNEAVFKALTGQDTTADFTMTGGFKGSSINRPVIFHYVGQ